MVDWNLTLIKANNGFIAKWQDIDEGDNIINHKQVFEINDDDGTYGPYNEDENLAELKCAKNMLNFILEHFGITYSKHNKHNLNVEIETNKDNE